MKTLTKSLFLIALLSASIIACPYTGILHGRVTEPSGRGIDRARITLWSNDGSNAFVSSNAFGYYEFAPVVACGNNYTLTVSSKRYSFAVPQVAFVFASGVTAMEVDFVSQ